MLHIHTDTDLDKVKQRHHDQHANNQTKKPEAKKKHDNHTKKLNKQQKQTIQPANVSIYSFKSR